MVELSGRFADSGWGKILGRRSGNRFASGEARGAQKRAARSRQAGGAYRAKRKPRGRSELRPYREIGTQAEACAKQRLGHLKVAATGRCG